MTRRLPTHGHTPDIAAVLRAFAESNRYRAFSGYGLMQKAVDEIERLRAEVGQLQRGAFVLNVHDRIYEAGKDHLVAWDSIDWESLSSGREAAFVPKAQR